MSVHRALVKNLVKKSFDITLSFFGKKTHKNFI